MVIAFICGGLGNQMFQYAMARRLAHHRNVPLKLDLTEYATGTDNRPAGLEEFRRAIGLDKLSITAQPATPQEIARLKDPYSTRTTVARIVRRLRRVKPGWLWPTTHFKEKAYTFDSTTLALPGDTYLHGYWQSEKYFADIAPLIRSEFAPRDPSIAPYAQQYVDKLKSLGGEVVSLHVRRGDLAVAEVSDNPNVVHAKPLGLQYISTAIARFDASARFLVFSDSPKDIDWCKKNIQAERLHFSESHTDIQDMAIMSACDHHIIANSTFSWWAAWLDNRPNRRVISPRVWSTPQAPIKMVPDDLVPARWEMI